MSIDPETRNLLTCALLNLDPRIVDKRTVIYCILIEVALYSNLVPMTQSDIQQEIDTIIAQKRFLSDQDFERASSDCLARGELVKNAERYELSRSRKEELTSAFQEAEDSTIRVRRGLIDRIELETGEPIDYKLRDIIITEVERILAEEVYAVSLQLARETLSLEEMVSRLEDSSPLDKIAQTLSTYIPSERALFRQKVIGGIIEYLKSLCPDLRALLLRIHHNVLLNQILNNDPSMIALERNWYSQRRLYLDTNVVISYIFEGHPLHSVVTEVIGASLSLKAQLFISPFTLDELKQQVKRAKKNHQLLERLATIKALASDGDDAILATFLKLQKKQPSLVWNAFIIPFDSLDETLLQYQILVEADSSEQANNNPHLEEYRSIIAEKKPWFASPDVVNHDTLNCSLIQVLREKYPCDERGQVVWLITIDRTLRKAQKVLLGKKTIISPYSIQVSDWGEIVLPTQNIMSYVFNDFVGFLAQARLGAIADSNILQLDFLETIHDAEVDVDRLMKLQPNHVRGVLSNLQTNREARSILERAASSVEKEEKSILQAQFKELCDQAIETTDPITVLKSEYDRKIDILGRHIESRDIQIEKLTTKLSDAESFFLFRFSKWVRKQLDHIFQRHSEVTG